MEITKYFSGSLFSLLGDLAVYYLCVNLISFSAPSASVIGYLFGLMVMYFLSVHLIFKERNFNNKKKLEVLLFFLSGLIGILITYSMVYVGSNLIGLSALVAKFFAVGFSFIGVYAFRKFFLFNRS